MDRRKLEATLGYYVPAFFFLKYNIDKSPQEIENNDEESIFIHEYIHFLQDLTTTYGNINLINLYNRLRAIVSNINSDKVNKLPLNIKYSDEMNESMKYRQYIFGSNPHKLSKLNSSNVKILREKRTFFGDKEVTRHYFEINNMKRYYIGALDILESHAYLVQREIYGDIYPPPELPYKTAEIIASNYSQWIFKDKKYLAVLCEIALSFTNPADYFINALERIKRLDYQKSTVDNFIDFLLDDLSYITEPKANVKSYNEVVSYYYKIAKEFAIDPVKSDDLVEAKKWIENIFDDSNTLKLHDSIVISRGLFSENQRKYYFDLINHKIGIPLTLDLKNNSYSFGKHNYTNQNIFFPFIIEIMKMLTSKNKEACEFIDACKKSNEIKNGYDINHSCKVAPWLKAKEDRLCPFAILFTVWGLSKYEFERR